MSKPVGRPRKLDGEKYRSAVRGLRIPEKELAIVDAAVTHTGLTFSEWARAILVQAAKRILK